MSFFGHRVELQTSCNIFTNDTHDKSTSSQLMLRRKWRRQTKTPSTDQLFKFVFRQDWCLSTCYANWKLKQRYNNVSRVLVYNWHGRFSDGIY